MRRASAWLNGWTLVAGLLLAWLIIHMIGEARPTPKEVPLSALARAVAEGKIASLSVQGDLIVAAPIDGMGQGQASVASRKEPGVGVAEALRSLGVSQEALSRLEIGVAPAGSSGALGLALGALPTLLIIGLAIWLARRGPRQADNPITSARQSGVQVTRNSRTRWADVAGAEAAKLELAEIVEFLKDPERFRRLGARVPRGVLLSGEPGTGKTLLARAVAGEAGVPFFYLSGSQFVEVFVGVGAARVRDLFQKAREAAPAIVFIDEIDAVGRRRGLSISAGHDEREQTLNQILVEMDGFEERTSVIVIAATNRVDVLDPALLRPGRFDRRIHVDLPDLNERRAILAVHARGKPFAGDVDLTRLARDTAGFSGADLANLLNEAAIFAAREHRLEISQCDLEEAVDRLAQGPRRTRAVSEVERRLAAVHEAGHAVVGALTGAGRVVKVTLVPRGPAGGYTRLDQDDRSYRSQSEFEDALAWMMGGRAAERLVLGETSTGSAGDLEQATNLARAMVTRFGMSRLVGPVSAGALSGHHEAASEGSNELVESEVRRLLQEAEQRAEQFLTANRRALDRLTERLLERETVYGPEVDEIVLGGRNEEGATRTATA